LDQSVVYSIGGFLLASLLAIIGFFIKREMRSLDKAKELKANEDRALLSSLSEISEAIAEMRVKLENFDGLNEEIE